MMLDVKIYTTSCKLCSFELCTIIYEDPSGNTESKDYDLQKLDCYLLRYVYYWHCLHPLDECVNGYEEIYVTP
jgi:hypothetical protein